MRYALRRAGQAAIVLIAAFTATFFLLQLLPGDAILIKFDNPELGLSPDQVAAYLYSELWSQDVKFAIPRLNGMAPEERAAAVAERG